MRAVAAVAAAVLFCVGNAAHAATSRVGARAPDFTLTDQDGRPFTLSAERGREVALVFGYTHCTDACPMTLARLARIRAALPAADRERFVVAFVTVDPQRDDGATLRRYVRAFDPSFRGLTGSAGALNRVYPAYGAWAAKLPVANSGEYRVAHDGMLTMIDPRGRLRAVLDWQTSAKTIASDVRAFLST